MDHRLALELDTGMDHLGATSLVPVRHVQTAYSFE